MKKSVFAVLFGLLSVTAAQAGQLKFSADELASLSRVKNVRVVVATSSPLLAVQPRAYVVFEHASCAAAHFEADLQETREATFVAIKTRSGMDCHGPRVSREYRVQISSDATTTRNVIVLNPLAIEVLRNR